MNRQKGSSPTFTPTYSKNEPPSLVKDPIMVKKLMNPSKIKQKILDESRNNQKNGLPYNKKPNPHKTLLFGSSHKSHLSYPNPKYSQTPTLNKTQPSTHLRPPPPHLPQKIVNQFHAQLNTNATHRNDNFDSESIDNHTKTNNEIFLENNPIRSINQTFNSCRITRSVSNSSHGDSDLDPTPKSKSPYSGNYGKNGPRGNESSLRSSLGRKGLEPRSGSLDKVKNSLRENCEVSGGIGLVRPTDRDGSCLGKESLDLARGGALDVEDSPDTKINNNCSTYRHRHNYYDSLEVNQEFTFEQKFELDMLNLPISFQGDGKSLLVDNKGQFIGDSL